MFCSLSPVQMPHITYECVECCGITCNFDRNKQVAGPIWFEAFFKRSPWLSVRKPKSVSIKWIQGLNKDEVTFFENLKQLMTKHSFSAASIYNMVEFGFSTVQDPSLV
jgi:hypothetical protein